MKRQLAVLVLAALACDETEPAPAAAEPSSSDTATATASAAPTTSVAPRSSGSSATPPPSPPSPPPPPPEPLPPEPLPRTLIENPPRSPLDAAGPVDPARDPDWVRRLASVPVSEYRPNRGGATLTIRARFADGERALFKAEQTHSASNFRAEIAAYHLDRLLGFARTAVVVGRTVPRAHLRQHLLAVGADAKWLARFDDEVRGDVRVHGAMIAWHSGGLGKADPPRGWERYASGAEPAPPQLESRLLEWSDMVVFDYLVDNPDRWSGGNILTLGKGGPLIFLDNAAGFVDWRMQAGATTAKTLAKVCRFRATTIARLRALGPDAPEAQRLGRQLRRSLARDPLAPVLAEGHYAAVDRRVAQLLAHIDRCAAGVDGGSDAAISSASPP